MEAKERGYLVVSGISLKLMAEAHPMRAANRSTFILPTDRGLKC